MIASAAAREAEDWAIVKCCGGAGGFAEGELIIAWLDAFDVLANEHVSEREAAGDGRSG